MPQKQTINWFRCTYATVALKRELLALNGREAYLGWYLSGTKRTWAHTPVAQARHDGC